MMVTDVMAVSHIIGMIIYMSSPPIKSVLKNKQKKKTRTMNICLLLGKGRVKEPVEWKLRHPKAYLLQVNGVKAISHTPDRDRVLPIVPEGTSEMEGGRQ